LPCGNKNIRTGIANITLFYYLCQSKIINRKSKIKKMEAKRKEKGSVGADLQIRNLDADTLKCLQELQEFFGVGTNSKAALSAVRQFMQYKNEIQSLRQQLADALDKIDVQKYALDKISDVLQTYHKN